MKKSKLLKVGSVVVASFALCAVALVGCSSDDSTTEFADIYDTSEGVAATVNGVEIGEAIITDYVENYRVTADLTDDDDWAQWLVDNDYTAEEIRQEVVEYYVSQELIRQGAEENGVTVDESEVDEQVELMRSYYEDDEAWEEALASVGTTEDQYRSLLEISLLQEGLIEAVGEVTEPTEEEILEYAEIYAYYYNGAKKSSHILFSSDDEETAQEVLDQINAGELDFAEAAAEYSLDSTGEDGGNVGWDVLNSFVDEYQEALDELEEGEVSDLVTSSYGIHIIMCTEVFDAPTTVDEDGEEVVEVTSTDQIPEDFIDMIVESLEESSQEESYYEWYEEFEEASEIVYEDMPEGLSYDVDLTGVEPSEDEDEDSDDESTDDSDDESTDDESEDTDSDDEEDSDSDDEDTDDDSDDSDEDDEDDATTSQPSETTTS